MRNIGRVLLSVAVLAIAVGGAAPAPAPEESQTIRLDRGPVPLAQAFKLKKAMGAAAFAAGMDAAVDRLSNRAETIGPCASPAETAAAAELQLVRRTGDPRAFSRSRARAEAALARRQQLRALYLGGAQAPFPYNLVGAMVARAKADPSPRLAELYRRMAEDQFSRIDSQTLKPFLGPGIHTAWEQGLDDAALAYVAETVAGKWCPMDVGNAAWLKADLRAHGWYRISTYGADADRAAWLIVQHARHDLAFEEEVLAMLEPLWRSGETKGEDFAMLYDQTARRNGRPARFGVDGDCTAPGVWTPYPLEDPSAVDQWRAKAGMPPLAQDIAAHGRNCAD